MSEKMECQAAQQETGTSASLTGRLIANRIFVGNIPSNLVERDLMTLFTRFGKIRDVKIIPENSRNKSYGFVTFFSEADARRALQHDCVMWGDRKLNVAPAVKRSNGQGLTTQNNFYSMARIPVSPYYSSPVSVPLYAGSEVPVAPVEPLPVDGGNGVYQTILYRIPHQQYSMPQCQYSPTTAGHYVLTPSYHPYLPATPVPLAHPGSPYTAAYPSYGQAVPAITNNNMTATSLTPNSSADNNDGQLEEISEDNQASTKPIAENVSGENESCQPGTNPSTSNVMYSPHPLMCCPHHSCMMSPASPAPETLTRSCQVLHSSGCYPHSTPLVYNSPLVYNTARRSARLQRWNSLDANIGHVWNNETWSRPTLDDSYASETALFPRVDRPLRPAFSCQSHGILSPFCRSHEYNLWGQGQANTQDQTEPNANASPSSSHSSLSLNLNLSDPLNATEQVQQAKK